MTDVAVVGAGIVGLATAYALRRRGATVTVYERGVPGNGQSGGESRIFRHLHDDPRLIALAVEARDAWRRWEAELGRELLVADGVLAIGPAAPRRLALLREAGLRARAADAGELPLLDAPGRDAILDEDGGVIRARAAVEALGDALRDATVADEVIAVRRTGELRAGGVVARYERVVVCAGRATPALARGTGLALPVRQSAHVRLTFRVRGEPPARLPCLLDSEAGAYGDPLPGNAVYAVGLGETPAHEDGGVLEPAELAAEGERIVAYVRERLPGLDPEPLEARHCWVTELPWSHDGIAVWERDALLAPAGNNLFKHAPVLGDLLARAALGEELDPRLRTVARLGYVA